MEAVMKFFADAMLGKLAKWLRVVGCDTLYAPAIDDAELAERAFSEQRVILTRDVLLIRRRLVRDNHLFIKGDAWQVQLRQVVEAFHIDPFAQLLTRCLRCNEPLKTVSKSELNEKVPPFVFEMQENFKACPACSRIFWSATHRQQMEEQLRRLFPECSQGRGHAKI